MRTTPRLLLRLPLLMLMVLGVTMASAQELQQQETQAPASKAMATTPDQDGPQQQQQQPPRLPPPKMMSELTGRAAVASQDDEPLLGGDLGVVDIDEQAPGGPAGLPLSSYAIDSVGAGLSIGVGGTGVPNVKVKSARARFKAHHAANASANGTAPGDSWVLPKVKTDPNDEFAGWTKIEQESEIPEGYCFTDDLGPTTCESSFFAMATFQVSDGISFFDGSAKTPNVQFTKNFTEKNLLRCMFKGSNGEVVIRSKERDGYWHVNESTGLLALAAGEEGATKFTMLRRTEGTPVLLLRSPSGFVGGSVVSRMLTEGSFLLPPRGNMSNVAETLDAVDSEILGYRVNALLSGGPLFPSWMAYDLALVVPLQPKNPKNAKFVKFAMEKARFHELIAMLDKFFQLVADKMVKEYIHYESLGFRLPQHLEIHKIASNINTTEEGTWTEVANHFISKSSAIHDASRPSEHLSIMTFANAKFKEKFDSDRQVLSAADENVEKWMSVYFKSSCALAWVEDGLTLRQKLNVTDMLISKTNSALLTKADSKNSHTYWFSDLLNRTHSSRHSFLAFTIGAMIQSTSTSHDSKALIELGLLQKLDPNFLAKNTLIGENIARPLFEQIDDILGSSNGVDLDKLYNLMNNTATKEIMEVVDGICSTKLIEIKLCVIPQIFRQAGVLSMYSRKIEDPNVVTHLETSAAVDHTKYLQLLQQDTRVYEFVGAVQSAKTEFVEKAKTLTDSLNGRVEDLVIQGAVEASKQIANTTSALATYNEKSAAFKQKGLDAQLNQRISEIRKYQEQVESTKKKYLDALNRIATLAKIRAAIEAFVGVVNAAFTVLNAANAFQKSESGTVKEKTGNNSAAPDFNPISQAKAMLEGFETAANAIVDTVDMFNLKGYTDDLAKELADLLKRMDAALPAIGRVQEASKPLTSGKSMNDAELASASDKFLLALRDYRAPVSVAELDSLQQRFSTVGQKFCAAAQIPTNEDCMNLPGDNNLVFTSLSEIVRIGDGALTLLQELCTQAINTRTLSNLNKQVAANAKEAADVSALIKSWGNKTDERQQWWFQWRKKQDYLQAAASAGVVLQQVYTMAAVVEKCDIETYLSGGVPSANCKRLIYSGEPVTTSGVTTLISTQAKRLPTNRIKKTAFIPTSPSYPGDLAYINLPKLLDGNPVYFKLPKNSSWLLAHRWISNENELNDSIYYVSTFRLYLPPRFADYDSQGVHVDVRIKSSGLSDMGPARQGKTFVIEPVLFTTAYTQAPGSSASKVRYHDCDPNLPHFSIRQKGMATIKNGLTPSLFTEWMVQAQIKHVTPQENPARIGYSKATTPILLEAYLELDKIKSTTSARRLQIAEGDQSVGGTPPQRSIPTTERETVPSETQPPAPELTHLAVSSENTDDGRGGPPVPPVSGDATSVSLGTCCPKGQYRTLVVGGSTKCLPCPNGQISQLGGLYCVQDPTRKSGGGVLGAIASAQGAPASTSSAPEASVAGSEDESKRSGSPATGGDDELATPTTSINANNGNAQKTALPSATDSPSSDLSTSTPMTTGLTVGENADSAPAESGDGNADQRDAAATEAPSAGRGPTSQQGGESV